MLQNYNKSNINKSSNDNDNEKPRVEEYKTRFTKYLFTWLIIAACQSMPWTLK